jgi:hypothetical protein
MTQLTDQLIAYARGGKFDVEEISIGDFISSTLPLIQYNIKSTVGVSTDIPHDILGIKADLTQMQMVVSAMISNASEAIDGAGCIRITGRNIEITEENSKDFGGLKPGSYICLKMRMMARAWMKKRENVFLNPFSLQSLRVGDSEWQQPTGSLKIIRVGSQLYLNLTRAARCAFTSLG